MKVVFEYILKNYLREIKNEFKNNSVAEFLRNNARETIEERAAIDTTKYKIEGSPGKGNWATIPWIGIFDKDITTTATGGVYIVYLFKADMSGVYLSLNQGWTFFENNYKGENPLEKIKTVADNFRRILNSTLSDFSDENINLASNIKLAKGYEAGHICGKFYPSDKIPGDTELVNDLRNLVGVYRELIGIVGTNYNNIVKEFLSQNFEYLPREIFLQPINLDSEDTVESVLREIPESIKIKTKNSHVRTLKEINSKETEEKAIKRENQLIAYLRNDEAQEKANGLHQKTLLTLAKYFENKGLTPKESVIDLLVENHDKVFIFEVKSIHTDNFRYQTRSAIGQLIEYEYFKIMNETSFENMGIYRAVMYSKEPPREFIDFLETSNFGVYWINNSKISGSEESMKMLTEFVRL